MRRFLQNQSLAVRVARAASIAFAIGGIAITGCGADSAIPLLSAFDAPAPLIPPASTETPPKVSGPFGDARQLTLQDGIPQSILGQIDAPSQVSTFVIDELLPGDRLTVDVTSATDSLDPVVAVFGDTLAWMHLNDDLDYYAGRRESHLVLDVRREASPAYVVVSASPRAETTGGFVLQLIRTSGQNVRVVQPQVVYLDFRGGTNVAIGRREGVEVPAFSGALVDPAFAPDTDWLIDAVTERVRADFAGFDLQIVSSAAEGQPTTPHSTVYFGSYNPQLLGLADNVDVQNTQPVQNAIVFVDTFSVFISQDPTAKEVADALANVASHEIGHLVGLHHTQDPRDIMDTTASLRQLLAAQDFRRAPLNEATFPVGFQDAVRVLLENLGGDTRVIDALRTLRQAKLRDAWYDEGHAQPARGNYVFSSNCGGR